ncbi:hypothetical protein HOY80DRAFT_944430 [Tuber brumale]|nr:hypothetical protein HOY80DRAFT_944430 [Tuber brumale]
MLRLFAKLALNTPRPVAQQPLQCRRFLMGNGGSYRPSGGEPNVAASGNAGSQKKWTTTVNDRPDQAIYIDRLDVDVFIVERGEGTFKADCSKSIRALYERIGPRFTRSEPTIMMSDGKLKFDVAGNEGELGSGRRQHKSRSWRNFWENSGVMINGYLCGLVAIGSGFCMGSMFALLKLMEYAEEMEARRKVSYKPL